MRIVLLSLSLVLLPVSAALSQNLLPQVTSTDPLRPLDTADAVRGFEAVGRLDTGQSYCSATLIAPNLVLTAAHCLFDRRNNRISDDALTFSAGLRNGRAEAYRDVSASYVLDDYEPNSERAQFEEIQRDIALLELQHAIPMASVQPLRTGAPGRVTDVVTVVSYGRDRDSYASIEEDCSILYRNTVVTALSCSVVPGSSGAPILREVPSGLEIVAVVSAIGDWRGEEAAFAVDVQGLLSELMAARQEARNGVAGTAATVRRFGDGDGGRSGIGARFLRP